MLLLAYPRSNVLYQYFMVVKVESSNKIYTV